jgi:hypothetical protein
MHLVQDLRRSHVRLLTSKAHFGSVTCLWQGGVTLEMKGMQPSVRPLGRLLAMSNLVTCGYVPS